jgi:hypothetical protein
LWRLAQGALDADHLGRDTKALVRRAAFCVSALVNAGLALSAVHLLIGTAASKGGDSSARDWTAYLLDMPLGQWLVGAAGLAVIGTGLGAGYKGLKGTFTDHLSPEAKSQDWVSWVGRSGYLARGLVFVVAGAFLLTASVQASAREARGLGGTLRALQDQPYGSVLFLVTAIGLFAFGVFQFVIARYRRIQAPDLPKPNLGLG